MSRINPIIGLDYPDPDVICVNDTFYMVSTTMYFMPGCEILRSYDLVHWEHCAYVFDRLDSTPAQRLDGKENIYGQGMWAASLRYNNGFFYICFVANDTHKTYVYQSSDICGPWTKYNLQGFYHDNSILFDDDGRVYIVYGNRDIYIKELQLIGGSKLSDAVSDPQENLTISGAGHQPQEQLIISDDAAAPLGYEGAHFYKIGDRYYIFLIHIPAATGKRTQSCFVSDTPFGPYVGKDIMDDTRGYRGAGVAQGGVVQSPDGRWYSILFQDSGAVGRIPILMPVDMKIDSGELPVFGDEGRIPEEFDVPDLRPGYNYKFPVASDDFKNIPCAENRGNTDDAENKVNLQNFGFDTCWQFNHEPDLSLIKRDYKKGIVTITTDKICDNPVQAKNTLTQRTLFPGCSCSVTVDGSGLKEGDFAGLCILESCYGFVGITRSNSQLYLVMGKRDITEGGIWGVRNDTEPMEEIERIKINTPKVTLGMAVTFHSKDAPDKGVISFPKEDDTATFAYMTGEGAFQRIGTDHKLQFKLDHFTGARFGLCVFSTEKTGGSASFSDFIYYL